MSVLNIGIIGCGRIADLHYPGYKNRKDARIYAVCDNVRETAELRKRQWKAEKAYLDYRDLLDDPKIDAVEILTPHLLHEPMVLAAAAAGKHIAVQKPMTTSLESADRMIAAARRAGVVYKVSDGYVWYPPTVMAKKLIEDGAIGTPTNLKIKLICGGSGGWVIPPSSWEWRMKEFQSGLPNEHFDHGHHMWAMAWYLFGEVDRVVSWIDSMDGVVDSPAVSMWKYREGTRYGILEVVCANQMYLPSKYYSNDEWLEITGTRGIITINRCNGNIKCGAPLSLFNGKWRHFPKVKSDWVEGFIGGTGNFIRAIKGEEAPRLSGEEGREVLRFAFSVLKSSKLRREVYLDEMDAAHPGLYHWKRMRAERRAGSAQKGLLDRLGLKGGTSRYAKQAEGLTEALVSRFDPDAVKGWECVVGLHLQAEGKSPELKYTISVKGGKVEIEKGKLPRDSVFSLEISAGTWAAILLKKEKLETAFTEGRLKVEGKAEEALKMRLAFGI